MSSITCVPQTAALCSQWSQCSFRAPTQLTRLAARGSSGGVSSPPHPDFAPPPGLRVPSLRPLLLGVGCYLLARQGVRKPWCLSHPVCGFHVNPVSARHDSVQRGPERGSESPQEAGGPGPPPAASCHDLFPSARRGPHAASSDRVASNVGSVFHACTPEGGAQQPAFHPLLGVLRVCSCHGGVSLAFVPPLVCA